MPYYPMQPAQSPQNEPPRKRRALRIAALCVSALLVLYGGYRLVVYGTNLIAARRTTQALREIASSVEDAAQENAPSTKESPSAEPSPSTAASGGEGTETAENSATPVSAKGKTLPAVPYPNGYELNSRIRELRKKSEYILGWITMDDLDEPVVYRDNEFFLNHDAMGKRNSNGAIFMDEGTSLLTRPYTILLYGHNMKSGAMFGNLKKYENYSYCYKHRLFQFDTLYEKGTYAIFAVEKISVTPGTSRFLNVAALESTDRETRMRELRTLKSFSEHDLMVDVNEEDQLLLLVTCIGDDDERLVLAARRLREGENI